MTVNRAIDITNGADNVRMLMLKMTLLILEPIIVVVQNFWNSRCIGTSHHLDQWESDIHRARFRNDIDQFTSLCSISDYST